MLLTIAPELEIRLLSVRQHGERLEETMARLVDAAYAVVKEAHEARSAHEATSQG